MKKIIGILLVGTMAVSVGAETLAYWDFSSDPQGVLDCSGNGNTLTNEGVRIVNGAAELDGTAHVFRTLAPVNFNKAYAYTVEFFARSDSDATVQCLIELSSSINLCPQAFFFFLPDGLMTRPGGYNGEKFKNCPVGDGQWHHYAGVFVPSASSSPTEMVQFYVDGVRQDQYTEHQATNVCIRPDYPLYIGSRANQEYPFTGAIDDIRITRGALAPADFLQTRTTNTALDVVCYYPFNHDDPLADTSGNGHVLTGSGSFADDYAHFDGTAHVLSTAAPLALSAYDAVTVEYFVHCNPGNDAVQMVYEYSPGAVHNQGSFFMTYNEMPGVGDVCGTFHSRGGWHIDSTPGGLPFDTGWHHVAMVCDRRASGDDQCRLYVDGVQQAQVQGYRAAFTETFGDYALFFGSRNNAQHWFDGGLDDFRITAQALQPGQFLKRRSQEVDDVVAYWDFDPRRGAFMDRSGNGYRIEVEGVTVSEGQAAVFDGAQTRCRVSEIPLWECASLTVEFFLRSTNCTDTAILAELSGNFNLNGGCFCATLNEGGSGFLSGAFNLLSKDVTSYASRKSKSNYADGRWHHVALVYDGDDPYVAPMRMYVDGVPADWIGYDSRRPMQPGSAALFLGLRNDAEFKYVGELDDVRITARALTPAEFLKRRSGPRGMVVIVR